MNSKFLFIFLYSFLCTSLVSFAGPDNKNSLQGTVRDKDGPLQGAIVSIPELKTGTVTDSNGYYYIGNLPKGTYEVEATLLSYAKSATMVTINGKTTWGFVLNESAIETKEVVITGQSHATEIRRSPVPIVAINSEYLHENSSTNIIDAIAKVPGVTAVTTGPNVSKPFIRGLGYNRVLTLFDGQRQEGQQWGDEHGIEVDENAVDRIEVIKGPASLIYGSDALAGVVNLIPTPPAPDGKIIGNVLGEYQTNSNLINSSAMLSGNNKGFYWLGRVSYKQSKDYQDPVDGRVYGTNYHETDASGSIGINKKWGYSHLDVALFDDLQAIPDGSRDSVTRKFTKQITEADTMRPIVPESELNSYAIPTLHQHVQLYRALLANSFNVGDGKLAVNIGFERSVRREFSHPEYADVPGLYLQLNTYTYDVKYFFHEIKGWDISAGVNGMYQSNNVTQGTEFIIPSYHQFDIGPFVFAKKNFGKLDVSGGIRYDSRTFSNGALYTKPNATTGFDMAVTVADTLGASQPFYNYSHTFTGMTYSLGLTYNFSEHLALKGNIARGFRAPNIAEISANGVHPGTNIYQIGNLDFKPEFSLQEDLGLDFTSRHISFGFSVFNNNISNYIYNQKVLNSQGQDSIIVAGNQTFKYQESNAQLYGGEADFDIHPHPLDWLHFENSISVVYGINKGANGQHVTDSEKYLPFIPPTHGMSELRGTFKKPFKGFANSFVKVQLAWYAAQNHVYLAYNTETPTPGYVLFNAGLGSDITNKKGAVLFNVGLFGNNLFNTAYQDHLSRLKYFEPYPNDPRAYHGIYNMGRNIGIKLSVPFTVKQYRHA